jgi:hypothetical protein
MAASDPQQSFAGPSRMIVQIHDGLVSRTEYLVIIVPAGDCLLMGWSGVLLPCSHASVAAIDQREGARPMSRKSTQTAITTIGIDIGKNIFHLVSLDDRGAIVLQLKVSRDQLERRLAFDLLRSRSLF